MSDDDSTTGPGEIRIDTTVEKGADRATCGVRDVPDDLGRALERANMRAAFDAMAFTHRKEWVLAVQDAKRPQTREKRIAECVAAMRSR